MLRCDDAGDGIRLGLRIVCDLESDARIPAVRVGVHSGPAVGHEGDFYGRAVNVASRLCAVAPGGEVLVSHTTREAAGRLPKVDFGERKLHWLRNVTEPVPTFTARERDCAAKNRWRELAARARGNGRLASKANLGVGT